MKNKKKIVFISTLLIAICLLSLGTSMAGNGKKVTYSKAPEIYNQIMEGYNGGEKGPIMITKGTLKKDDTSTEAYFVFLSGTELISGQATDLLTDLQAGFQQENDYNKSVVNAITKHVPNNSNIILSGHSLGGMIAQQASADPTLKDNYNIINVVTFGSPLIKPGEREGDVKRLGDSSDPVPYLSGMGVLLPIWQIAGLNREDGGYGTDFSKAHTESYTRDDLWGKYDVLGYKDGNATFTFYSGDMSFFKAPSTIFPDADYLAE